HAGRGALERHRHDPRRAAAGARQLRALREGVRLRQRDRRRPAGRVGGPLPPDGALERAVAADAVVRAGDRRHRAADHDGRRGGRQRRLPDEAVRREARGGQRGARAARDEADRGAARARARHRGRAHGDPAGGRARRDRPQRGRAGLRGGRQDRHRAEDRRERPLLDDRPRGVLRRLRARGAPGARGAGVARHAARAAQRGRRRRGAALRARGRGGAARAGGLARRPRARAARGGGDPRHAHARGLPAAGPAAAAAGAARRRAGADARPARAPRARGGDRGGAPRPRGRAARLGPGGGAEPGAGGRDRAGADVPADARPGAALVKLSEVVARLPQSEPTGNQALEIASVTHDSRRAGPGALFVAIRGLATDGNDFVDAARKKGAVAVVSEAAPRGEGTWVRVKDARKALALFSAAVLGDPARRLDLVGVTGTNGKTTTAYLIDSALRAAGETVGLLGTVEYRIGRRIAEAVRTTPESSDLQALFREMVDAGCSRAVLEVSSHSLELKRVAGCAFRVAVFTNLTRDHLDFHGDMDAYFAAKRRLFAERLRPDGRAVLNADDSRVDELRAASPAPAWTYGIESPADFRATHITLSLEGTRFHLDSPVG